jgi:TusE/DsrC/DsvC family sulfur relay protein
LVFQGKNVAPPAFDSSTDKLIGLKSSRLHVAAESFGPNQLRRKVMTEPADRREEIENEDGFLREMSAWSREIAQDLAQRNDLGPLIEDHWTIIDYVRDYYQRNGIGPSIVKIAKATGFKSGYICHLFPCGVARGAYRLAGLPRPYGCL